MSARSAAVASHQVAITRRGITRAWPGLTGYRSAMANAESFAARHSDAGTARNGESPSGILAPIPFYGRCSPYTGFAAGSSRHRTITVECRLTIGRRREAAYRSTLTAWLTWLITWT